MLQVGNYVFNTADVLGRGSTGTVYLGHDVRNKAKVAIKVIELKTITNEVTKYLLKNQIKALQITNHPNVLHAYDVVSDSNCYYVVTNYCPNQTLEDYIKAKGRIPEREAVRIFAQIVEGYASIRMNNILHRDLKPSNILFSESQKPVICDFGYCEVAGYLPKPKMYYNVGSPAYMAPEAIAKNISSQEGEIWSLGTIFYEMLQGKSFADGRDTMEAIMQMKKTGPYIPDGVSEITKRLITKCMELNPSDRIKLKDLRGVFSKDQPKGGQPTQNRVSMTQSVQYLQSKNSKNMLTSEVNHITLDSRDNIIRQFTQADKPTPSIIVTDQSVILPLASPTNKQTSTIPLDIKKPSICITEHYDIHDADDNKSMISKPEVFPEYMSQILPQDDIFYQPYERKGSNHESDYSITSEMRNDFIASNLSNLKQPSKLSENHEFKPVDCEFTNELKVPDTGNMLGSKKSIESNKSQNDILNSPVFLYPTVGLYAKNVAIHQITQPPLLKPVNSNVNIPTVPQVEKATSLEKNKPSVFMSFSKPISQLPRQMISQKSNQSNQYYQSHIPTGGYYPQSGFGYAKPPASALPRQF